jgi:MPBQ/MSBQ methyltransferase
MALQLAHLDRFKARLEEIGFTDIIIEHLQMRVAPSVSHIPWVTLKFLLTDGKRLTNTPVRRDPSVLR